MSTQRTRGIPDARSRRHNLDGMSQVKFSYRVGVSLSTIQHVEDGGAVTERIATAYENGLARLEAEHLDRVEVAR